jgi:hypothetical protein
MHLLHITLIVKLLDEIIYLNGCNHLQILTEPFGGSINLLHVPQQWWGDKPWNKIFSQKFEESPLDDDEGGVGGMNCTLCLVKPLIKMSMPFESCVTSVMNPNLDLYVPPKI